MLLSPLKSTKPNKSCQQKKINIPNTSYKTINNNKFMDIESLIIKRHILDEEINNLKRRLNQVNVVDY